MLSQILPLLPNLPLPLEVLVRRDCSLYQNFPRHLWLLLLPLHPESPLLVRPRFSICLRSISIFNSHPPTPPRPSPHSPSPASGSTSHKLVQLAGSQKVFCSTLSSSWMVMGNYWPRSQAYPALSVRIDNNVFHCAALLHPSMPTEEQKTG